MFLGMRSNGLHLCWRRESSINVNGFVTDCYFKLRGVIQTSETSAKRLRSIFMENGLYRIQLQCPYWLQKVPSLWAIYLRHSAPSRNKICDNAGIPAAEEPSGREVRQVYNRQIRILSSKPWAQLEYLLTTNDI